MLGVIIFLIILAIALMLGVVITVKKHAYKMLIDSPFVGTLVIVIMMIILGTMRYPKNKCKIWKRFLSLIWYK